ncbi:uncharacterized protein LOC135829952 [Sycon ciliatum]|uniref:uncharacterized protein LOC135829952 n=1 Tax=Sycon ciliatum TaxID=27933 RepID=UPI0031F719AE
MLQCAGIPDLTDSVRITGNTLLHEGSLADIYAGELCGTKVAVKCLRAKTQRSNLEKCRKKDAANTEWRAMSLCGFPHVVQFIGIVRRPLHHPPRVQALGVSARSGGKDAASARAACMPVTAIVMERCVISLEDIYRSPKALRLDELMQIFRHIISAICFLHDQGIIHCDVNPRHIMMTAMPPGQHCNCTGEKHDCLILWKAKLIDFESSQRLPPGEDEAEMSTKERHDVYTAPEVQVRIVPGRERWAYYGKSVDIYSVGATMIAMFTRQEPEQHPEWNRRFKEELKSLGSDHAMRDVLMQCVQYESKGRPVPAALLKQLSPDNISAGYDSEEDEEGIYDLPGGEQDIAGIPWARAGESTGLQPQPQLAAATSGGMTGLMSQLPLPWNSAQQPKQGQGLDVQVDKEDAKRAPPSMHALSNESLGEGHRQEAGRSKDRNPLKSHEFTSELLPLMYDFHQERLGVKCQEAKLIDADQIKTLVRILENKGDKAHAHQLWCFLIPKRRAGFEALCDDIVDMNISTESNRRSTEIKDKL